MVTENEIEAHLIHERLASDNVYIRPETLERSVSIIETKMHDLYLPYIFSWTLTFRLSFTFTRKLNNHVLLFVFRALYPPSGKTLYYDIENKLPRSTSARYV